MTYKFEGVLTWNRSNLKESKIKNLLTSWRSNLEAFRFIRNEIKNHSNVSQKINKFIDKISKLYVTKLERPQFSNDEVIFI